MDEIKCINCGTTLFVKEIKKGINALCSCGCQQMCVGIVDKTTSQWRVMNPFSFKDVRDKK